MTVKSINGKTIRLTDERWLHKVEGHPEMAGHLNEVLLAVAAPDKVLEESVDELLAIVHERQSKLLVVVYKEETVDGFILTAFFTSKVNKLSQKTILWQK